MPFNAGPLSTDRVQRFQQLDAMKMFTCPSNDLQVFAYSGSTPTFSGTVRETSYCAAALFMFGSNPAYKLNELFTKDVTLPIYRPNIYKVGNGATKIFVADGAKYSTTGGAPDINLTYSGSDFSSQFVDNGAYSAYSHSWDRGLAPGNANPAGGTFDARFYAYRHGGGTQGGASGSFKMNSGFYDGHVEVMTDADSANPSLWAPSGTTIDAVPAAGQADAQKDTVTKYFGGQSQYLVP